MLVNSHMLHKNASSTYYVAYGRLVLALLQHVRSALVRITFSWGIDSPSILQETIRPGVIQTTLIALFLCLISIIHEASIIVVLVSRYQYSGK